MTNQQYAIDFSRYLPPGVYTQSLPGPQLSVNSTLPTAVGIFGKAVGYRTAIQTVQINPDSSGPSPSVSIATSVQGSNALNDTQGVNITGTPTGGTFTLRIGSATTSALAYNATAGEVQSALEGLSSVGAGNVTVDGANGGPYTIVFVGDLAAAPQDDIVADGSSLTGGSAPGIEVSHTQTGTAAASEVQKISVTATGGTFTLVFQNQTTEAIVYNASATTVQKRLTALSSIGAGNVTVTGNSGGPYTVNFGGALGDQSIETLALGPDANLIPSPTKTLDHQGIDTSSVIVTNPNTGKPYTKDTDFTVISEGGTAGTSDALYALERVIGGHIDPGDFVQISYRYTDPDYFKPYIFYDYDDVREAYGDPFDKTTGKIVSELSLMAKFAFVNGAYQVICVAVDSPVDSGFDLGSYEEALQKLADQHLIAVVVAGSGAQPLHEIVKEHVDSQSNNRFERRAICGVDGTITPVSSSQRIIDAEAITDRRVIMVSPASFTYFSGEVNQMVTVGGQYMAAALAGLTVSMSFAMPLTRKTLAGWTGIGEFIQEGQKNLESQNGLCVVEKTRTQLIQVRHGVTTDPTDLLSREWSIIGQEDAMVYRLRDYLESDNLIGQPIYPYTLISVKGSAESALQSLIRDGLIVDYTGLKVRQLATNPDVLEVTYGWLPAFPLNYIVVSFSVSLTSGNVTSNNGTSINQSNVSSNDQTNPTLGYPPPSMANDFGGPSNTLRST